MIRLLDDLLIDKIAAGEVVDRPASVVKELLENALDAGADKVTVHIAEGGRDLIEVSDNGAGIDEKELALAFLRHATSKINKEEDLLNIATLGFRGEALPSIAAVSRVEITTCQAGGNGVKAELAAGKLLRQENTPFPQGTKIIIKDLFYNTPARKEFLKSAVTEGNQVYVLICRYALARPEVSFTFTNNKRSYFKTPGNGKLSDVVRVLWGEDYANNMLPVDFSGGLCNLQGLVSRPSFVHKNRRQQIFFVNRRPVKSPMLFKAIDQAYKSLLVSRQQPIVILNIDLPPNVVDVNIHPQKMEVRFKEEGYVFTAVSRVISNVLNGLDYMPDLSVMPRDKPDRGRKAGKAAGGFYAPTEQTALENRVFEKQENLYSPLNQEFFPDEEFKTRGLINFTAEQLAFGMASAEEDYKILGQIMNTYIIVEKERDLWIIDQHAAHEKIIYVRFKQKMAAHKNEGQNLAIPLALHFNPLYMNWLLSHQDVLNDLGFHLEPLGETSMLLRTAPAFALGQETELLNQLCELKSSEDLELIKDTLAMSACKKALKGGTALNAEEIKQLVDDLLATEDYRYCPHGRPTLVVMDRHMMDRVFKRQK
ncbi:MAG: DNA mismatch repair endonuclease MutL [Syntrophomonadaceae bacterium]|jgi:DNA mismatch repair protein MutL|nr:DNA mismatch repair endonuclease MutL [Syntrophomonadaceae bacterium]